MNKVININFQGRVIPIEEPAYEELKKYVDSLRNYFANEEGREEIINDIENRIAELFGEKLKAGDAFISEAHVLSVIESMGRPEQFDELDFETAEKETTGSSKQDTTFTYEREAKGSLYRNENDKMLAGVCSGIASYFKIDTTLVRVLFSLLAFGAFGTGVLLYIILWAILPSKYLNPSELSRKLYRDTEQKAIGGVCSGIAHYFNIAVWIPRLIFALPVLVGLFKIPFTILFFPIAASFSGTMFLIYIILWVVVPKAMTASEKLEMKGQRVDLASIKHKVQDELTGLKKNFTENAETWKSNVSGKIEELGKEVSESSSSTKQIGSRLLRFVVTLFKIFLFFIVGFIAIALTASIFGIGAVMSALMPLKNFIPDGDAIQWYVWGTLLLFVLVPIIGILRWLIRSIIGHRSTSTSRAISITLLVLWILGWASVFMLTTTVSKQFMRTGSFKSEIAIMQPTTGKFKIGFSEAKGNYSPLDPWADDDKHDTDGLMLSRDEDSLLLSNIRIKLNKSRDSQFHVTVIKKAKSSSLVQAENFAEQISYTIKQQDSLLLLPIAFPITQTTKFRNQQVLVEIEVPVGKEIYLDGRADELSWYSIKSGRRGLVINIDDNYEDEDQWSSGVWYIMKERGIEKKYPDQDALNGTIENIKEGIRRELDNEKVDLENMEIKVKKGDTTVNLKIKI